MKTIAHISDLHFGTEQPQLAAALRSALHAMQPALVVVSGDLTQRAREGQFIAAREYLRSLPHPQLVVPGNHDVPLYDVARRFLAPLARYRRLIADEVDPLYDDGDLFVAGLNTARSLTWQSGRISVEQIARLQSRLRASSARLKIVTTHHPFVPPPVAIAQTARIDLVGRAAQVLEVLDREKVDLLLAGHLHRAYSGDTRTQYPAAHRAIVAAQAGTAISHRVRHGEPNAFNRISLEDERMTVEVCVWNDATFAPTTRATYERHDRGWSAVMQTPK
jgi:3',5'-cyclic AMP phosphodiesterase CpdA